ncbi:similar to Saccharomyces cerevisiae YDR527W RBA50 Protein involved in transcription [Maudiozyma saulgeensis]|uniref:Similar to Saccharomyces cerevisiae YDR527W RBA50 Protein involved in transcription n=1 Tax=Maudiozyma saulgeensis TaxID=1789683 RepID=A0A1X7R7G0_9SACH|nr:similar to Saccharomyces cerevisiae YDR527W RBA50 Protein involved in transcription [Kazachstania saulgeensis]
MDLLGDIVEKDPYNDSDRLEKPIIQQTKNGFPELYKPKKISSWKQRLQQKKQQQPATKKLSEAESIHMDNIKKLNDMTEDEILKEKKDLLNSLDPKLIQNLLKNINKRQDNETPLFAEIEGASGTWVGGFNENLKNLPSLSNKQVNDSLDIVTPSTNIKSPVIQTHKEDVEDEEISDIEYPPLDEDDVAPLDYQMAQAIDHTANEDLLKDVHFVSPHNHDDDDNDNDETPLDINDPNFDEKLHSRYFPHLPKDIDKLKWMKSSPEDDDIAKDNAVIESVADCRFDFNGNLVPPTRDITSTTTSALHHHSQDPQLAGYTILELDHLSRSTYPSQRCIAIQTLGRILYKLGKQSYYQLVPEIDAETYQEDGNIENVMNKIYAMFWEMLKELQTIQWLEFSSIEKNTPNLSVRNYAIDALWLWKQGGGDFRNKK